MPGSLAVAAEWKPGPTRFEVKLIGSTLSVSQDGSPLGSIIVPEHLLSALHPAKLAWGQGMYGPLTGKLTEPSDQ